MNYLSDAQLWQSNSPTQRQDQKDEISYKVLFVNSNEWDCFDDKDEANIFFDKAVCTWVVNCEFDEPETIQLLKVVNDTEEYILKEANTLEIAFNLSKLTIELYQIKSTQFELTSDEMVRINEIESEIKDIINL